MKVRVLDPSAEAELLDALAYHEANWVSATGRNLYAEFAAAFGDICARPAAFPPYKRGYRMYAMPGLPYVVYYLDLPARVFIAAIGHARRKTDYWKRRRPPSA
jgi:toxin ParE1/3/4